MTITTEIGDWVGSRHWIIHRGARGEFIVEPMPHGLVLLLLAVLTLIIVALLWSSPLMGFIDKAVWTALSVAINSLIGGIIHHIDKYQQQRGPYIVLNEGMLLLRDGVRVELSEFAYFKVDRREESFYDGPEKVSQLSVVCKSGVSIDVLKSLDHKGVGKLLDLLNERVAFWRGSDVGQAPPDDGSEGNE